MSNFYCAAPWRGLHINPRGDVKTCCAGDPNMLGNLNQHTIQEILHGPAMAEIRQTLRSGRPHQKYCYNCIQAERYGRSERDWHNSVNADFDSISAEDQDYCPTLIDVRWNTTCNLSCNYCAPACSSTWSALKGTLVKSGARPYYQQVCDYLEQHKNHIREVALVGGEPLLLPENARLLEVLPEHCTLTLITNLSVDLSANKIFDRLSQHRRVGWSMSFDNIGAKFEYVRHGGDWNLLLTNIDKIKGLFAQGHWGGIHAVYNIYSATGLIEFTKFARHQGLDIHWQSLYQPACLDPQKLGSDIQRLALEQIDKILATDLCRPKEREFFETVRSGLVSDQDLRNELVQHVNNMEQIYHTDQKGKFIQLWPEISKLL